MANTARGEVDVIIAGKSYPLAMTLDALGRVADALGVATLSEIETRILAFNVADFKPIMAAVAAGNGSDVSAADLGRMSFRAYTRAIVELWSTKALVDDDAGEADPSPQKRAS